MYELDVLTHVLVPPQTDTSIDALVSMPFFAINNAQWTFFSCTNVFSMKAKGSFGFWQGIFIINYYTHEIAIKDFILRCWQLLRQIICIAILEKENERAKNDHRNGPSLQIYTRTWLGKALLDANIDCNHHWHPLMEAVWVTVASISCFPSNEAILGRALPRAVHESSPLHWPLSLGKEGDGQES